MTVHVMEWTEELVYLVIEQLMWWLTEEVVYMVNDHLVVWLTDVSGI